MSAHREEDASLLGTVQVETQIGADGHLVVWQLANAVMVSVHFCVVVTGTHDHAVLVFQYVVGVHV